MPPILDDMLVLNIHTIDWHKTFFATDGHEYEIICYKFSDMWIDQRYKLASNRLCQHVPISDQVFEYNALDFLLAFQVPMGKLLS